LEALGVPVQKASGVPETFSVPTSRKSPIIKKPQSSTEPYKPEPVLDASVYGEILRICRETGIEMERHPAIYDRKGEEVLRDHFLMILSPHFQSATRETFNRSGKTDILIRHEGSNVFVAECKLWSGEKQHLKTIDQLLSYLTWRDSKTAIFYFVRNKQLEPVLGTIGAKTPEHPCFVKERGRPADGHFAYRFHLLDDDSRAVEMAVVCFHFPPIEATGT